MKILKFLFHNSEKVKVGEKVNDIKVRFYFVSGETMTVVYTSEKFDEIIHALMKSWRDIYIGNEIYGINFGQVTHYQVVE